MNLTSKQFENTLRRVLKDETSHFVSKKEFKQEINNLILSVDSLALRVDSFLTKEWNIHLHDAHPRIESRINRLEKKFSIK